MSKANWSRRRFIGITAAAGGLALLPMSAGLGNSTSGLNRQLHTWRGTALGADAILQIHHPDTALAEDLIARSISEVHRLERVFSLYDQESALSLLNRQGFLDAPPSDLLRLISESNYYSRLTNGAFDPTVQPLWKLYAAHFMRADADPNGPSVASRRAAEALVGFEGLTADEESIRLARPGMCLTLNGIAQGYITDRVAELLFASGIDSTLIDMGETRALGERPAGGPWIVGIEDPRIPANIAETIGLKNRAVSTSGGYGTQFDKDGRFNHIFDPKTGLSSSRYLSVSVIAPLATMADALSTAFSVMRPEESLAVVRQLDLSAHYILPDGPRLVQSA